METGRQERLVKIPLFAGVDPIELAALAALTTQQIFEANAVIVREGDPSDAMFLVLSGGVAVIKALDAGRSELLDVLMAGEYFGEMSLLTCPPRSATVMAMEPVTLLRLGHAEVQPFLAQHPRAGMAIFRAVSLTLSQRLRHTTDKVKEMRMPGVTTVAPERDGATVIRAALCTPLTVLKGAADLLMTPGLSEEKRRYFFEAVRRQVAILSERLQGMQL